MGSAAKGVTRAVLDVATMGTYEAFRAVQKGAKAVTDSMTPSFPSSAATVTAENPETVKAPVGVESSAAMLSLWQRQRLAAASASGSGNMTLGSGAEVLG